LDDPPPPHRPEPFANEGARHVMGRRNEAASIWVSSADSDARGIRETPIVRMRMEYEMVASERDAFSVGLDVAVKTPPVQRHPGR